MSDTCIFLLPTVEEPPLGLQTDVHPLLAVPPTPIIYDIRFPPSTLRFHPLSPYSSFSHADLDAPLTFIKLHMVSLFSREFPWTFDVCHVDSSDRTITCMDVLLALYEALYAPLLEHDWALADAGRRDTISQAQSRRIEATGLPDIFRRVDWLGSMIMFKGISAGNPGTTVGSPNTWIVTFGYPDVEL